MTADLPFWLVVSVSANAALIAGTIYLYRYGSQWKAKAQELEAENLRLSAQNAEQSKRLVNVQIFRDRAEAVQ